MSRFIVKTLDIGDNRYMVKDTLNGWFIPTEGKREAEFIKERFEEVAETPSNSHTLEEYFNEWEKAILELNDKGIELINLKESYAQIEQDIIDNTNFKELYGANNQKVRDNHVKNELKDLVDKKHDLELRIDYLKRRIDFIKSLMRMQGILLESGVVE